MDNKHGKGTTYHEPKKNSKLKLQDADHWQLTRQWILWYTGAPDDAGECHKRVAEVETIHQFWSLYAYIHRPQQLPSDSGYFFFKNSFLNEDSSSGCCRIIYNGSTSRGQVNRINEYWQRSLIAVAGEQFGKFSSDVCGVSIAVQPSSLFQLILWVENALNASQSVKGQFKAMLGLPEETTFELEMMDDDVEMNSSVAASEKNQTNKWLRENRVFESSHALQSWPNAQTPQKLKYGRIIDVGPNSLKPLSSPVLTVQGFKPEKLNCQKIYNLFSSYGECVRVFFLLHNSFCECHVEMGDGLDAANALRHLSGCLLDGNNLYIRSCHIKTKVYEPKYPFHMPDMSPTFKDFSIASTKVITPEFEPSTKEDPSNRLCFYNAPANLKNTTVWELLDCFSIRPRSVVILKISEKTSAGSITFKSDDDAMAALMLVNNYKIVDPVDRKEYIIQLCFGRFD